MGCSAVQGALIETEYGRELTLCLQFPIDVTKNSTITVNTTAILSDPKCSKAAKDDLSPPTDGTSKWTLVSTLGFGTGCVSNTTIDVSQSINQYGVQALTGCSTKGDGAQTQAPFAPAFFWFYTDNQVGTPIARGIFCFPSIEAHIVEATVDGATTLLTNVTSITTLDANGNNVTGGSFAGKAFNGYVFSLESRVRSNMGIGSLSSHPQTLTSLIHSSMLELLLSSLVFPVRSSGLLRIPMDQEEDCRMYSMMPMGS